MTLFRTSGSPVTQHQRLRPPPGPDVLAAVADPALAEQVRQVVAASGRALVESQPRADRRLWRGAGVVVMDAAAARACVAERLVRSSATVLVAAGAVEPEMWQLAVHARADFVLALPGQERELVRVVGEAVERWIGSGRVVAVIGARGGSGVSTLVAATALVSARSGARSLAVDLDPLGGGLDVLLGMEREPGLRWVDLSLSGGRVSAAALHAALPNRAGMLSVLAAGGGAVGEIETESALAVIDSARSAGDTVVVDLPRRWTELQQAVAEAADSTIVVLPAELRSITAGRSLASAVADKCPDVCAVARGPSPGGLRVGRAAAEVGLPLVGVIHYEKPIAASVERGGLVLRRRSSVLRAVLDRRREKTGRR